MSDEQPNYFLFLVFLGIVLVPDFFLGNKLWHQCESWNFPSTTGQITRSELARWTTTGRHGDSGYEVIIHYHYEVNGQAFDGARLRYSFGSARIQAALTVNGHPVGSETQVFYNPKDPADSLLSPGLDSWDIVCVQFLVAINMLVVVFGVAFIVDVRNWLKPATGGAKIIADGIQTRVRLPYFSPISWGAIAAGAASFVSILIVIPSFVFSRTIGIAATFLFLSIASGIAVYVWRWRKIRSGYRDLIIDEESGFIELPKSGHRRQRVKVNISDIVKITVEAIKFKDTKGNLRYNYAPTLRLCHGKTQQIDVWVYKSKADSFSEWFRKKLGAKAPDLEDQRSS